MATQQIRKATLKLAEYLEQVYPSPKHKVTSDLSFSKAYDVIKIRPEKDSAHQVYARININYSASLMRVEIRDVYTNEVYTEGFVKSTRRLTKFINDSFRKF